MIGGETSMKGKTYAKLCIVAASLVGGGIGLGADGVHGFVAGAMITGGIAGVILLAIFATIEADNNNF